MFVDRTVTFFFLVPQIMLGVFLVVPPMIVWAVWAGLGGLWIIVFFLHEIVYLACKIKHRKDE